MSIGVLEDEKVAKDTNPEFQCELTIKIGFEMFSVHVIQKMKKTQNSQFLD